MRKITLVIMLMLFCFAGNSQTSLAPGDIAFIGSNADGVTNADDSFAFVLLKDIDAATQIIFTDKGWNDDTGFTNFPGDGEFVWTSGVARQANDIVTVSLTPLFPAAYALIGDQLFALQGSTALPTFIAGLQYNNEISSNDSNWDGASVDNATSALPDALTTGENAVRLINGAGLEQDNWQFDCDLLPGGVTLTGSKDELGVIINNRTYWSSNNTNVYNPVVKGTCVYSVLSDPTITFAAINKNYGDANFNLNATSNSAGTISYSIVGAANGTVLSGTNNATVTLGNVGDITIRASQTADGIFSSGSMDTTLSIVKADQTITFGALAGKDFGDADFNLTASASSGLTVSYISSNTDVATVSGNIVTIVGAGTTNITASQIGNTNYNAATDVSQSLTVGKADQTITFGALAGKDFGDTDFNLTASASSGLTVSYISSNTDVATVSGNTVTIVGAGTTNITASQIGDTNYNAATDVSQSLTVGKADQTITFGALIGKTVDDDPFTLTGSSSSGLTISYVSSNPLVATVTGNTVTIVGAGNTIITASQIGDTDYNAATDVPQNLNVGTTLGVDNFNLASVSMFPNPAQDVITLQNPEKLNLKLLTIYDLAGRLMQKEDLTIMGSEKVLNVSGLSTATYLVIIESEKGNLTKLLIKK